MRITLVIGILKLESIIFIRIFTIIIVVFVFINNMIIILASSVWVRCAHLEHHAVPLLLARAEDNSLIGPNEVDRIEQPIHNTTAPRLSCFKEGKIYVSLNGCMHVCMYD
jgi:hypothetical protein